MIDSTSNITIYKASAGSGKTFQLTGEYLKLIFNPSNSFKNILAVTFTNKATGEMRERILNELYLLSEGKPSGHTEAIQKEFSLSNDDLKIQARELLNTILHSYGNFNVSTIDSFFQIILKTFIREIGLNAGFSVELNFQQVLEISIEQFLDTLDEKPQIKKWLSEFAMHKIEESKSWDIQKDIYRFSKEAFTESFFAFTEEHLGELANLENFDEYRKTLKAMLTDFVQQVNQIGVQGANCIAQNGLTVEQFTQKEKGVAGFFIKLKNARIGSVPEPNSHVLKAHQSTDGIEGWVNKTSPDRFQIQQCVQTGLQQQLNAGFVLFETSYEKYLTAIEISKNLEVFAVLVVVFNHLLEYCHNKNIFLLPLAAPLLDKMIQESDTPFIYEKTGSYFKHIMIDEFQDTSTLQWNNFYPLFTNSISQGNKSLVVGDVKQSIYRWRNGNWSLLQNQLKKQFAPFNPQEVNLPYNWRSHKNIVDFNNWAFKKLARLATEQADANLNGDGTITNAHKIIEEIYEHVGQQVPIEKSATVGYASLRFFDLAEEEFTYQEKSLTQLIVILEQLFEKGYQPKDIAILIRRNYEGALVAKTLMDYRIQHPDREHLFSFVSNDSVFLKSSSIINYLVSALHYIADPSNQINKAQLLHFYWMQSMSSSECAQKMAEIDFSDRETFESFLPIEFTQKLELLRQLPIAEMTNQLLYIFIYNSSSFNLAKHAAFIHTFQDVVLKYTKNYGVDVPGFIEWWHESANETTVSLSDEQNAIRILTIHKSKGLEYKAVIVPFADWKLDQQSKIIWCKTDDEPFSQFNLVPLTYSKKLNKTRYKSFYKDENIHAMIDSLNLLYVAFTRAEQGLFIMAPKPKKLGDSKDVGSLLFSMVENATNDEIPEFTWDESKLLFETGKLEQQTTPWESTPEDNWAVIQQNDKVNLQMKLTYNDFLLPDSEDTLNFANRGKVYHSLLENIKVPGDLPQAISKLEGTGLLSSTESKTIEDRLNHLFLNPIIADWFNDQGLVLNESSILLPNGNVNRPDRVIIREKEVIVIDYKFTAQQHNEHDIQMHQYMESLALLENKKVTGFIWYVLLEQIKEVSL